MPVHPFHSDLPYGSGQKTCPTGQARRLPTLSTDMSPELCRVIPASKMDTTMIEHAPKAAFRKRVAEGQASMGSDSHSSLQQIFTMPGQTAQSFADANGVVDGDFNPVKRSKKIAIELEGKSFAEQLKTLTEFMHKQELINKEQELINKEQQAVNLKLESALRVMQSTLHIMP